MTEAEQKRIFDEWLSEHKGILFKILRAYAFTPADQEDLFQEMAFQVWKSVPDFLGKSKPSTWIYRVALFTATAWLRREKRRPEEQPLSKVAHTLESQIEPQDDRLNWLYDEIGRLEPLERSICLLLLEGFPYREIAELIGLSESHVGVRIHRIKKRLKERSREYVYDGV